MNDTYCIDNKAISIANFFQEASFVQFELRCQTKVWLIASSIMLFLAIVVVLVFVVVKRYRVPVDYIILRLRSRWRGVMRTRYSQSFQFDAFVTYTEEDYRLACHTFYQVLRNRGLKISLPDKDFLQGLSLFNAELKSRLYRYRKVSGEWLEFVHCPDGCNPCFSQQQRKIYHRYHQGRHLY